MLAFPAATAITAALLTIIYVFLTVLVIKSRRQHKVAVGAAGHSEVVTRHAAHENFSNYFPVFILLLYFYELAFQERKNFVLAYGALFVIGRISHIYSVLVYEKTGKYIFRVIGMASTFFCLVSLSLQLIFKCVETLF